MCTTCGCGANGQATVTDVQTGRTQPVHGHEHPHVHHDHDHSHSNGHHHHPHDHEPTHTVRLEEEVLARNNRLAERNRGWLAGRNITALNLVSSHGAGKTTLLERTIRDLGEELKISVIEGDQETANDAERVRAAGCRAVQINTGAGCHLDAAMIARGLETLDPPFGSVMFIENVGNLVCPALFDLGEQAKVVIVSVTEGEDKPLKYPHMFRAGKLLLLNKIDLAPHVDFDADRLRKYVRRVNPVLEVLPVSARRGDGLAEWYTWLRHQANQSRSVEA